MRVAFAILCFGAVAFLLRVLVAMVQEAKSRRRRRVIYFAIFSPSGPSGKLIEMKPQVQQTRFQREMADGSQADITAA